MATKKTKTFSDVVNPAMQFITPQAEDTTTPSIETKQPSGTTGKIKTTDAPEGYKANPAFVETKSRRLQLLMQPSLHDRLKARAKEEGLSVNEFVHLALEKVLEE